MKESRKDCLSVSLGVRVGDQSSSSFDHSSDHLEERCRKKKRTFSLLFLSFSFLVISTVSIPPALFALLSLLSSQIDWRLIMKHQQMIISLAASLIVISTILSPLFIPIDSHLVSFEQMQANERAIEREVFARTDVSRCIPVAIARRSDGHTFLCW